MKKLLLTAAFAFVAVFSNGCFLTGQAPVEAPKGLFFANYRAPLSIQAGKTDFGTKIGRSKVKSYCWFVTIGDMSIKMAAKNGSITVIKHVDYEYTNIALFLYQETTTIVYGD
ncbi:MAG: hypothetical protein A2020_02010 [Lentisphaerae bacterium GWF2_45_14]|nr:MAG: hypothetical protein A2020_02010 [Lentisphaerae bacterium GWF2_45_14]